MAHRNQASNPHRRVRLLLKSRLVAREMKLGELAVKLGHDIAVVSKAINHGTYPRVLRKVKEALNA
jgi:hypothetical protein